MSDRNARNHHPADDGKNNCPGHRSSIGLRFRLLLFAFLFCALGCPKDPPDPDQEAKAELVASITYDSWISQVEGIFVDVGYAYVNDDSNRLIIFDVADPANPTPVGRYEHAYGNDQYVKGDYAYLPMYGGFTALDISDRSGPSVACALSLPMNQYGSLNGIDVSGDLACCSTRKWVDSDAFLLLFDIASPTEISLLSSLALDNSGGEVIISGSYAYVLDSSEDGSTSSVKIVSIADPEHPAFGPGSLGGSGLIIGSIAIKDGYLFASSLQKVNLFDISDPAAPGVAAEIIALGGLDIEISKIRIEGDRLYVCTSGGLRVYDVTSPTAPSLLGESASLAGISSIFLDGERVFSNKGGLWIDDAAHPTAITELGHYYKTGNMRDIYIQGDYALILDERLLVADISDPYHPAIADNESENDFEGQPTGLEIKDNYLYVTSGESANVLTIDSLPAIGEEGAAATPGWCIDIAAEGDFAYVADQDEGLAIIDIADPAAPVHAGNFAPFADRVCAVAVLGDYLALAYAYEGLKIFNVSDQENITEVFSYDGESDQWCPLVRIHDDILYAAFYPGGYGIRRYDLSSPSAPVYLGTIEKGARTMHFSDGYCSIASDDLGFSIYDISDRTAPVLVLRKAVDGLTNAAAMKGDFIFVANGTNGLKVYKLTRP